MDLVLKIKEQTADLLLFQGPMELKSPEPGKLEIKAGIQYEASTPAPAETALETQKNKLTNHKNEAQRMPGQSQH